MTDSTTGLTMRWSNCALGEVLQQTASGMACTAVVNLAGPSGVTPGTYGSASQTLVATVDASGRVTNLSSTAIAIPLTQVTGAGQAATHGASNAAGDVVLLAAPSTLPTLNGAALTNVNAATLNGYPVSSVAPTTNYVLTWNGTMWVGQNANS